MKKIIPQSIKNIYHLFQAISANLWHGFPSRKIKVIGVTGTNGKTTTVQMIAKILEEANYKIAVSSTINFKIADRVWVNKSKLTTLSSWALQKFLREAVEAGCEYAVLEVSSHSLDQNRVWGVDFSVAVITNVTREHLDYHKTMEEYSKAKEKLFAMASKKENSVSVVNLNTEFAEKFLKYPAGEKYGYILETQNAKRPPASICEAFRAGKVQNYNSKLKTIIAENIELGIQNTKYQIQNTSFQINLPSEFNVENALAATCVGLSQGIALPKISEALARIKGVPGRMERIENDRGLEIIVDYAVTPDSLKKLYDYIGGIKKAGSKIIAVFGSCGERDRGKRPIMGEIVTKAADYCIVTNEDPYREDPTRIIDEVFEGVIQSPAFPLLADAHNSSKPDFNIPQSQAFYPKTEGLNAFRILDRREAIKTALRMAKPGDIIVVTGKGAEETMAVGDRRIPWNDPKVIQEVLREIR